MARRAGNAWNVTKTLLQIVFFWGFFLGVLPALTYWIEQHSGLTGWRFAGAASQIVGVVAFAAASCVGLASAITMAVQGQGTPLPLDSPRALVVAGPYQYLRNPMAASGITQGVAIGIYWGSPTIICYSLCGALVWNYIVRPWEERELEDRFGDSFRRYRAAVRCWLPRWSPYREA